MECAAPVVFEIGRFLIAVCHASVPCKQGAADLIAPRIPPGQDIPANCG